jgi:hypothetical protein
MPPLLQQHESGSLRLRAWTELLPSNYIHRDYILDGVEHGFSIVEPDRIFGFVLCVITGRQLVMNARRWWRRQFVQS